MLAWVDVPNLSLILVYGLKNEESRYQLFDYNRTRQLRKLEHIEIIPPTEVEYTNTQLVTMTEDKINYIYTIGGVQVSKPIIKRLTLAEDI